MSKARKKFDNQLSIFELLKDLSHTPTTGEGHFRIIEKLKTSMRGAIKGCPLSRHQIAGEMSHLLGESITKEMIDSWTRESDEQNGYPKRHIPAEYLPAFCQVTRCHEPLQIMCQLLGIFVLPGPEALRADIQKVDEQIKELQAQKKKQLMFLKEIQKK